MPMRDRYLDPAAKTVLLAFAFAFLDWLFLATKPSFLTTWPVPDRILGLFTAALPWMLGALVLHAAACLLAALLSRLGQARIAAFLPRIVPALVVAAIVLMLVDNFTYTVFSWGIVRTTLTTAPAYWLLVLGVVVLQARRPAAPARWRVPAACALLAASGLALGATLYAGDGAGARSARAAHGGRLPNIILFASDGVNADFTSAYGYARKTTPNLDRYLDRAMVVDNGFTNSAWTTGSLTSMLTGKYPTTTKVLFPPYTLQGADVYQSLPRLLRQLGYRAYQETVRYYADGPDLNFDGAFDEANGRTVDNARPGRFSMALQRPAMLVRRSAGRLSERVQHLLFIKPMDDPFAEVAEADVDTDIVPVRKTTDEQRMQRIAKAITTSAQPFFMHIHLLDTHCCKYRLKERHFSKGKFDSADDRKQAELDDAILASDRRFGRMMDLLERRGLLDNTIVVVTSDHNTHWEVRARVPMVFIFPHGDHRGHVPGNSQLIDVAPTLLDYLGVDAPDWMEGASLLHGGFERTRPIYSIFRMQVSHFRTDANEMVGRVENIGPPTYGLRSTAMVVCQRWYIMQLENSRVVSGDMDRYVGKCPASDLPDAATASAMMSRHLHDRGIEF
jgi:arylsulfatase A-like enzyme